MEIDGEIDEKSVIDLLRIFSSNNPFIKDFNIDAAEILFFYCALLWLEHASNVIDSIPEIFDNNFNVVSILGPLRPPPKSKYSGKEFVTDIIGDELIDLFDYKDFHLIIGEVNSFLKAAGIDYEIKIRTSGEDTVEYSLIFVDKNSGHEQNYTDVGFGLSQVMPIFFALQILRNHTKFDPLMVIEQPELHLHPKAQANLAKILLKGLSRPRPTPFEKGQRNRMQMILETHSEHLVRGFQVLVAKGELSPNDIVIHYIDKDNNGNSFIQHISLNEDGSFIEPWPKGFFDQGYLQALELMAAGKG